jgi:NADPH-dependent 7-cyano-7-deazaguanine reductase QueF
MSNEIVVEVFCLRRVPDWIHYSPPFKAFCSIGQDNFSGTIHISYSPNNDGVCLEFMSFEAWLEDELTDMQTSAEELCVFVFEFLKLQLNPRMLTVEVQVDKAVHAPVVAVKELLL